MQNAILVRLSIATVLVAGCGSSSNPHADAGTDIARMSDTPVTDVPTTPDVPTVTDAGAPGPVARHSSSIAVSPDGSHIYVVNADADSVSIVNVSSRTIEHEILLAPSAPALNPTTQRYDLAVGPRALALSPMRNLLYVTGERSGDVSIINLATTTVTMRIPLGSEPAGVLVAPDESAFYVAESGEGQVARIDANTYAVTITPVGAIGRKPWGLAWSTDGSTLYVTQLLASALPLVDGPAITALDPNTLAVRSTLTIPRVPRQTNALAANGEARGIYDMVARPGSSELWVPHMMLATGTIQVATNAPDSTTNLDFENSVFPTVSVLAPTGGVIAQMTAVSQTLDINMGSLGDIISGPHAIEFTPDGNFALVVNAQSDDMIAIDATGRFGARTLHPVPGHLLEGVVLSPDGTRAYIDARNTETVVVVDVMETNGSVYLTVDGTPIPRIAADPMPANLRLGQRMFYSADSDGLGNTQNHWIACANCHVEARTDAVTWLFATGPRDTPSNAGGALNTGFLLRTGDRSTVADYWRVVVAEQGGLAYAPTSPDHTPTLDTNLQALQSFVNYAIPLPVPPHTDPTLVARGQTIFETPAVGCAVCHNGVRYTDSGSGNPTLNLASTVLLHDVGTCVMPAPNVYPDQTHLADDGSTRMPCVFDTPELTGIADSAPYLHDGSAATLLDVLNITRGHMGDITGLSSDDLNALVEYLKTL